MSEQEIRRYFKLAAEVYISVVGIEKWNSLTDQQKHDACYYGLLGVLNALGRA